MMGFGIHYVIMFLNGFVTGLIFMGKQETSEMSNIQRDFISGNLGEGRFTVGRWCFLTVIACLYLEK